MFKCSTLAVPLSSSKQKAGGNLFPTIWEKRLCYFRLRVQVLPFWRVLNMKEAREQSMLAVMNARSQFSGGPANSFRREFILIFDIVYRWFPRSVDRVSNERRRWVADFCPISEVDDIFWLNNYLLPSNNGSSF